MQPNGIACKTGRFLLLSAFMTAFTCSVHAAEQAVVKQLRPAQPIAMPGKIEVVEFFSYACPHCKEFHPLLEAWKKNLPPDVAFRRVPITFGRQAWVNLSKLYYALQASDQLERFDGAVFNGIHNERANLYSAKSVADWLRKKGGDADKFVVAFNSFGVQSKAKRAHQESRNYRITGVPSMAVNGKFLVEVNETGGLGGMLQAVDTLVSAERKASSDSSR